MKPVVTWIVLANARTARIVQNKGPGKGVIPTKEPVLQAPDPVEFSDDSGVFQNSADHSHLAGDRTDPKRLSETAFARMILERLTEASVQGDFDRLVLVAGPHMLGTLRAEMPEGLRDVVTSEVDRDLTNMTLDDLPKQLGEFMAA